MTVDILKALGISNGQDVVKRQQRLAEVDAELATQRFRGASRDNTATAIVTGRGDIFEIVIRDDALRSSHPELVGPAVVEALTQARIAAGQHARAEVLAVTHPDTPVPDPSPAAQAAPPTASAPSTVDTRRPRIQDDDDFSDYDFLDPGE
ncbi:MULTISPECIES: YbaB/EbfC family nucleoid-associated protein [unclassified Amycolatopsis]|uniref:YbaB/EbfC family nucleoid-associated protein n=1 Tax=unclassified Amycolatopsis TaxID=2618356 RepID=UPI002E26F389|nr:MULTISPECIES: YbaB/EbfC family nucleoid-associated protein [unclassified Amycolatopsis]